MCILDVCSIISVNLYKEGLRHPLHLSHPSRWYKALLLRIKEDICEMLENAEDYLQFKPCTPVPGIGVYWGT
jgi:hypothetical protein